MSMLTLLGGAPYQPLDNNGAIVPGGLLTFKIAGTGTKQDTYSDAAGTIPNTNPVVLDGFGRASIYLGIAAAYDIYFTNPSGATIWTQTNVVANKAAI